MGNLFGHLHNVGGENVILVNSPSRAGINLGENLQNLAKRRVVQFLSAHGSGNQEAEEALVGDRFGQFRGELAVGFDLSDMRRYFGGQITGSLEVMFGVVLCCRHRSSDSFHVARPWT